MQLEITNNINNKYQYCAGNKIKKNEMGGACSAYGGQERWVDLMGSEHLEDLGAGGKIILRWIFMKWGVGV